MRPNKISSLRSDLLNEIYYFIPKMHDVYSVKLYKQVVTYLYLYINWNKYV